MMKNYTHEIKDTTVQCFKLISFFDHIIIVQFFIFTLNISFLLRIRSRILFLTLKIVVSLLIDVNIYQCSLVPSWSMIYMLLCKWSRSRWHGVSEGQRRDHWKCNKLETFPKFGELPLLHWKQNHEGLTIKTKLTIHPKNSLEKRWKGGGS